MPIVALHGVPFGDDAPALPASAPLSTSTKIFWLLSLTAAGYVFWATLQTPKRKKARA